MSEFEDAAMEPEDVSGEIEAVEEEETTSTRTKEPEMTPDSFINWLFEMKEAGLANSDAACGRLLDISANSIVKMKRNGADRRTALACTALLHRMEPYE